MKKTIVVAAIALIALSGCTTVGSDYATDDPIQSAKGSATNYVVITDWRKLPSNNENAADLNIRIVKIENVCFIQTASLYDSQYTFNVAPGTC